MSDRFKGVPEIVTATAAGIALLYFLRDIIIPFILAIVLAVLVSALVRYINTRSPKAPRWASEIVAGLIVILSAVAVALITARGVGGMFREAPALIDRLEGLVRQIGLAIGLARPLHLATLVGNVSIADLAGNVAGSLSDFASGLLLMVTYFVFMLAERTHAPKKLARLANSRDGAKGLEAAMNRISSNIETYLWVQTVTGVMISGASFLVMAAAGLDNALFWTTLLFLLSFIPLIGVTVGSIVPALFTLLQFPTWWQAAVVFGGIQIVAFVVGNLIYPRMQAETQNISPVATLLSLAFWGWMWGIIGAFLAVPMTLIVMMICAQFPRSRWLAVLLSNDGRIASLEQPAKPRRG
jgi:predicted PurR-regulated permease PerM